MVASGEGGKPARQLLFDGRASRPEFGLPLPPLLELLLPPPLEPLPPLELPLELLPPPELPAPPPLLELLPPLLESLDWSSPDCPPQAVKLMQISEAMKK